jgi:hypothetical protein
MPRELPVDRAIYLVDDSTKTYRFARRNPEWRSLPTKENERNKCQLDGYTRILRDGRRRVFEHRG